LVTTGARPLGLNCGQSLAQALTQTAASSVATHALIPIFMLENIQCLKFAIADDERVEKYKGIGPRPAMRRT
jgi:hypothetical protein